MRKNLPLIALAYLVCCVFSCKKDKSPGTLIVGQWKLQQTHLVNYLNGTKVSDTTYSSNPAYATNFDQFNNDGSFTDIMVYSNGEKDTIWANYNLTGSTLSFSNVKTHASEALALTPSAIYFFGAYGEKITSSLSISQLTADKLSVHSEITATDNNVTRVIADQSYTK